MLRTHELETFLRAELAPKPGRLGDALRVTVLAILVMIISETYQIPFTAYSTYVVLFVSKEEAASTVLTGLLLTVAVTLSVIEALAVYMISAGEPGLRLPLMAVVVLAGMFISRASPLGPIGFATGFLATLSLTLIDSIPAGAPLSAANLLTRLALWLWVVAMLPIALVVIGNLLTGRDPFDLFKDALKERLELSENTLNDRIPKSVARPRVSSLLREGTASLLKDIKLSALFNKNRQKEKALDQARVAKSGRLLVLSKEWTHLGIADRRAPLLSARTKEIEKELSHLHELPEKPKVKSHPPLFLPDAFTNPDYFRYALKCTLAIFVTYIAYNLVDWPGIRTCMITCFFVTLGSFGETSQKMILRIAGALIGGGLGLAAVVFAMPYLTTITGLCLLVAPVLFVSAWIASSSERLSYAGLQIGLAFVFSTLVGYGPSVELSESRDRIVGIIFGNIVVYLIFSNIWPVSASQEAGKHINSALIQLSRLFSGDDVDESFLKLDGALAEARRFALLDPLEPQHVKARRLLEVDSRLIEAIDSLRGPALVLGESRRSSEAAENYHRSLSQWLSAIREQVIAEHPIPPSPSALSLVQALESGATPQALAYSSWYRSLDERVHAFETATRNALALHPIHSEQELRGAA
jgi:multidrug resistance protein MdtO